MKVIVIGGGVIGTTTAHYLHRAGAQVVLLEKNKEPALETSFANAGSITASRAGPWASPATIIKTLKNYLSKDSAFRISLGTNKDQYLWLAGFFATAFSKLRPEKRDSMVRLGLASLHAKQMLDKQLPLNYGPIYPGLLTIYQNHKDFASATADIPYLNRLGIPVSSLSADECRILEPKVNWQNLSVAGGLMASNDESSDCHRFTQELTRINNEIGVETRWNSTVQDIDAEKFGACTVKVSGDVISADAVVITAGVQSIQMGDSQKIKLPIIPVKGYSISVKMAAENRPKITISDERRKVFISPTAEGLRAAGVADIVGYNRQITPSRINLIKRTVSSLYPHAELNTQIQPWAGLRAMTHDGPPVICGLSGSGLWLNTGHGSLGWTFACGSAEIISQMILSKRYDPDDKLFGLSHRWFS